MSRSLNMHTLRGFAAALTMSAATGICITARASDPAPVKPKIPAIVSVSVEPASLTLNDARDSRTFLVTGHTAAGYSIDLSGVATIRAESPIVRVDRTGYVSPVKAGKTDLIVTAAGRQTRMPVTVKSVASPPISFVREVMPLISKVGCNAGTCHGSAKGKNGFKLSLRGYDPDFDYHALIDDVSGRRFNRADPGQSLMLLKPTGSVPHRGGVLFTVGAPEYNLLKTWISQGVRSDAGRVKRAASLEVIPAVPNVTLPGMSQKMVVIAHYPDGSTRDVTREAVFTSSMPETATISTAGEVSAVRRGEAACLVRYEGSYAANNITVLGDRTGYKWVPAPELNYIDKLVDAKLQKIKALPGGLCDDASFVRRISIDLTGLPPTAEVAAAFLADKTPSQEKRQKLVDQLLKTPDFVDRWTNKWADLLDCNSKFLGEAGVHKFRNWIHSAVAENMPYDKFVNAMMVASGDDAQNPAANYMRVVRDTSTATENITQLFLGVRFSCAKCHDHPFERWTQNQYYQLGAFFARVGYKTEPGSANEVVYDKSDGEVMHPKTGLAVLPTAPVGHVRTAELSDRRLAFADWLTSADNPFFSRAMVNRLWSYFLGKGIIDPVDDIRASNPASNPQLLEALNRDFVSSGFDMKHMMRTIVLSRTYQEAIQSNKWNADDKVNFSHAQPRRLEAEQLLDAIDLVTGAHTKFGGLPAGTLAEQVPDATVAGADGFLDLFGKPSRDTPCECERSSTVSLGQAMNLINGPTMGNGINSPTGRLAELLKPNPSDQKLVDELFLTVLSRYPSKKETAEALANFKAAGNRADGAQDLMWALLNSPAFLFNR